MSLRMRPLGDLLRKAVARSGDAPARGVVDARAPEADQAHEHTYQTPQVPGAYVTHPDQLDIVGVNGRRLIVRWVDEGVYVGGCLITDPFVAERLASWVTREDDDA